MVCGMYTLDNNNIVLIKKSFGKCAKTLCYEGELPVQTYIICYFLFIIMHITAFYEMHHLAPDFTVVRTLHS